MKKFGGISLFASTLLLFSCGGMSESEAMNMLNQEAAGFADEACDCIQAIESTGDTAIEEEAVCRSNGLSKISEIANDKGIADTYPKVLEEAEQYYNDRLGGCGYY
jgi:hypothetical protein